MTDQILGVQKIPSRIALKLDEIGAGPTGTAQILEAAIARVLDASGAEKFAMMKTALPLMEEASSDLTFSAVQSELVQRFRDYCAQKGLRPNVLLVGALLIELDMASLPEQPDLPEHCA
jgi:hypothetical protein